MGHLRMAVAAVGHHGIGPGGRIGREETAAVGLVVEVQALEQAPYGRGHVAEHGLDLSHDSGVELPLGRLDVRLVVPPVGDEQ